MSLTFSKVFRRDRSCCKARAQDRLQTCTYHFYKYRYSYQETFRIQTSVIDPFLSYDIRYQPEL